MKNLAIIRAISKSAFLKDTWDGGTRWRLWLQWAWVETKSRYARTVIGPFWISLTLAIQLAGMTLIFAKLFKMEVSTYMPYVAAGLVAWSTISSILIEGCGTFLSGASLMRTTNLVPPVFVYKFLCRTLIAFMHNMVIILGVALAFPLEIKLEILLIIPAVILYILNGYWIAILLGLASARYRDLPYTITAVMNVMFIMTPIFWRADMLSGRRPALTFGNPFFHFVEIFRQPMLGNVPLLEHYIVVLGILVAGFILAAIVYVRHKRNLAYWL